MTQRLISVLVLSIVAAGAIAAGVLLFIFHQHEPTPEELAAVSYAPQESDTWEVASPADVGMNPDDIARLFYYANCRSETVLSVVVLKDGKLIAEDYFNGSSRTAKTNLQSVTKSITSCLVGTAIEGGCIKGVDEKMMEFFPELTEKVRDSRKTEITVRHLLQMRAGYPWEESTEELFALLYHGFKPSTLLDVELVREPGSGCEYSNLSSHLLGVAVARAANTDLQTFAQKHLFGQLEIKPGEWMKDWESYYLGYAGLNLSAYDMAKFGQMYLHGGIFQNKRIVSESWVNESLSVYSKNAWGYRIGKNVDEMNYGYQWWQVRAGQHEYWMAWGHGGQQIILFKEYNMVIVVKADPLHGMHGSEPWRLERLNLNMVADFIAPLPVKQ